MLDVISRLSRLEISLRGVDDSIGTAQLATIELQIGDLEVLVRRLRRFEERIKRYLRGEAGRGADRWEVIAMVRDRFSPEMRDFICGMGLLSARIRVADLQVRRVGGLREGT